MGRPPPGMIYMPVHPHAMVFPSFTGAMPPIPALPDTSNVAPETEKPKKRRKRRGRRARVSDEFVKMFKARTTYQIVEPADMELAETTIKDAFAKCVQHGATRVIVALESVKIYTVTRKGLNQIKTKELICLSVQKFVNCYTSENYGCNGGLMDYAYEYIKKNGSITTEKSYPYVARQRSCDNSLEESQVVTVDGYQDVPRNNENALLKAVANQPVSVAIEASGYDFQFYYELFVARSMWFAMEGKM
ncbi:Thiol protease SEN102 [Carex littledalei]|uniref:Thiol protease SEN102 n=1 Tax=Carex littledalei TaxID=544730 RepID=A0A833VBX6_9POAL|nr:Thiol protease SEN102 [Carex littledalei]